MKHTDDRKVFVVLLLACVVATILVLPYIFVLNPALAKVFTPIVLVAQLVQAFVIFSVSIFFGLRLARRVGFGLPLLEGRKPVGYLRSILGQSVGLGVVSGVLIILFSVPFSSLSAFFLKSEMAVPPLIGLSASFYGGIAEEIIFRLFVMTFIVWVTTKVQRTPRGRPTVAGIWIGIGLSAILFGLGHLPMTGSMTAITSAVVLRAVVLNGIAGVICGWLYWKNGLESAIIAHFSADIVLHVITPIVALIVMS